MPCSGRRGNRASEVEVGLLGLPRQNIEPSSLQEKLHVDLTGQGSRGKRHRGKAESPETTMLPTAAPPYFRSCSTAKVAVVEEDVAGVSLLLGDPGLQALDQAIHP